MPSPSLERRRVSVETSMMGDEFEVMALGVPMSS